MADQEVIKHTKKIYRIWKQKESNPWNKVKEFFLEIFIIVFAVSLSIWLHSWNEHRHERADVKAFLIDLKTDLLKDIDAMNRQKDSLNRFVQSFIDLRNLDEIQIDSLNKLQIPIKVQLSPIERKTNIANYEGFKSSGSIKLIENKQLKYDILNYYQQEILSLEDLENTYNRHLFKLQEIAAGKTSKKEMYLDPSIRAYFGYLVQYGSSGVQGYDDLIKDAQRIIEVINEETK